MAQPTSLCLVPRYFQVIMHLFNRYLTKHYLHVLLGILKLLGPRLVTQVPGHTVLFALRLTTILLGTARTGQTPAQRAVNHFSRRVYTEHRPSAEGSQDSVQHKARPLSWVNVASLILLQAVLPWCWAMHSSWGQTRGPRTWWIRVIEMLGSLMRLVHYLWFYARGHNIELVPSLLGIWQLTGTQSPNRLAGLSATSGIIMAEGLPLLVSTASHVSLIMQTVLAWAQPFANWVKGRLYGSTSAVKRPWLRLLVRAALVRGILLDTYLGAGVCPLDPSRPLTNPCVVLPCRHVVSGLTFLELYPQTPVHTPQPAHEPRWPERHSAPQDRELALDPPLTEATREWLRTGAGSPPALIKTTLPCGTPFELDLMTVVADRATQAYLGRGRAPPLCPRCGRRVAALVPALGQAPPQAPPQV